MTHTRRPGAGRGRCVAAPIAFQLYGPGIRRGDGN
jgi:hypothetical protein